MCWAGGKVQGPETGSTWGDADPAPHCLSARGFLLTPAALHPQVSAKTKTPLLPSPAPRPRHLPQATVPALCGLALVTAAAPAEAFRVRGLSSDCSQTRVRRAGLRARTWGGGRVFWSPQSLLGLEGKGQRGLGSGPRGPWGLAGVADWPPLPPDFWPGHFAGQLTHWVPVYLSGQLTDVSGGARRVERARLGGGGTCLVAWLAWRDLAAKRDFSEVGRLRVCLQVTCRLVF